MDRYTGKPFLRLLDSYVLDAIGQLSAQQRAGLEQVQGKLQAVYKTTGAWQDIVRQQLDLPLSFPLSVQKVWKGYLDAAHSQGISVSPGEFVQRFVDENFPETK
jgi:hypothetical protein